MPIKQDKKIVIIGGGPMGIGAAYRLFKFGYKNWMLYEKNDYLGGRSSTHKDENGFLWDEGGHVLFSHFSYFNQFVNEVLGKDFYRHQRESWIKLPDKWVPYPFQNNIRYLNPKEQLSSLVGLIKAQNLRKEPKNFKEWIMSTFGDGIANIFMLPFNFKVWATPAEKMTKDWVGERVSVVKMERVLENIIFAKNDVSWGPNNNFLFPKYGGTRETYERAGRLFARNLEINKEVIGINFKNKILKFADGATDSYDYLISAMPIDKLIEISDDAPSRLRTTSQRLVFNSVYIVGIGVEKKIKTSKCWVYFPDSRTPFYRMTYFHNYSPYHVPKGDISRYSSLMCEVSYSRYKKVNRKTIIPKVIKALIDNNIIEKKDEKKIVSKFLLDIPYGYPVPTLGRDKILRTIQPFLMNNDVYSRGRYGAWKYEISNMDHCFMQGVEAVDKILKNKKETVWS